MAGRVSRVESGVTVVAEWVLGLDRGVKLNRLGWVQALHAAPGAILVWTFPQVASAIVKPTGQVRGGDTERSKQKETTIR